MSGVTEIKKLLGNEKLIIGTDRVLKNLRSNKIEKAYLSSNCNADTTNEVEHLAGFSEVKVEKLDLPNDELGVVCKKTFSVSVIGILK